MNTETITPADVIRLNDSINIDDERLGLHHVPTPNADQMAEKTAWLFPLGDLYLSETTKLLAQAQGEMGDRSRSITKRLAFALSSHVTGKLSPGVSDLAASAYTDAVCDGGHQIVTAWEWPGLIRLLYPMLLGVNLDDFPQAMVVVTSADRSRTVVLQDSEVHSNEAGNAFAKELIERAEGGQQE